MRFQAVRGLGGLTDGRASGMLLRALRDADEYVRGAAAAALRSRGEAAPVVADQERRPEDRQEGQAPVVAFGHEIIVQLPAAVGTLLET